MGDGVFIVIEGPDASGKATQAARLVDWLRAEDAASIAPDAVEAIRDRLPGGYDGEQLQNGVWALSFPTYDQTPGGRVVQAYLDGAFGARADLSFETRLDIYAADRFQFKEIMQDFHDAGGIIVSDRYREANLIHQLTEYEGAAWEQRLQQAKELEAELLDPDVVYYLDIPPRVAAERMADRDKDIHEADEAHVAASNENGRTVAEHEGWTVIDADRDRAAIAADIQDRLRAGLF